MRRHLLIACGILCSLAIVAGICAYVFYGRIATWVIREKVIPKVEKRLGRDLYVGDVDVDRGKVTLRNISLPGDDDDPGALIEIDEVTVTYDYGASWVGDVVVHEVSAKGLRAALRRRADGSDNFRELLRRLRPKENAEAPATTGQGGGFASLRPDVIRLVEGEISLVDEGTGAIVEGSSLSAILGRGEEALLTLGEVHFRTGHGPSARLADLIVHVDIADPLGSTMATIGDGELSAWNGMSLTGIAGEVKQGDTAQQLVIDLSGSYGGSKEKLWKAEGWLEPLQRKGQLTLKAEKFTLNRIASVLEESMVRDFDETSIDAELLVEVDEGIANLAGQLNVSNLNLHHPMLSEETMHDISFKSQIAATMNLQARTLVLEAFDLETKGVKYKIGGDVALAGGRESDGSAREHPRFRARVVVPKAHCQAVLQSIPAEFVPKLQGFELAGIFEADVRLEVDWSDLEELTVLDGFVSLPQCKIVSPNEEFDTRRLTSSFQHQILVGPEEYETVDIGMESDNYAQIFDVASPFLNAVLTQEDSRFYEHKGFIPREFRGALVRNLIAGRFKFGASSITMQMVKNVFLNREKTISRKLQEFFLTWYVEETLEKDRILEIYVNAIEYGPGVYGIVKASKIYFGKHPRDIKPIEAAFLAHLLPAPRKRYFQYCKGVMSKRWRSKVGRILTNMHRRHRLTDEEYEEASEATLEFNPDKVKTLCKKLPDW
jgi:hypothetical protein